MMEIGGNKIIYWMGNKIKNLGEKWVSKGKPATVTNPSAKLANPFTLIISFTVDSTEKYQLVTQGRYKEKYKNSEDGIPQISENEMMMIIMSRQKSWFKKE
jgi:hypothetical protein